MLLVIKNDSVSKYANYNMTKLNNKSIISILFSITNHF